MNIDNMRQEKKIENILKQMGNQKLSLSTKEIDFEYQNFSKKIQKEYTLSPYITNFNYFNIMNITKKFAVGSVMGIFALVAVSSVYAQSSTLSLANEIKNSIAQGKILSGVSNTVKLEDLSYGKMLLKAKSISKEQALKELDYEKISKLEQRVAFVESMNATNSASSTGEITIVPIENSNQAIGMTMTVDGKVSENKNIDISALKEVRGMVSDTYADSANQPELKDLTFTKMDNMEKAVKFLKIKNKDSVDYIGLDKDKNVAFFGQVLVLKK